MATYSDDFGFDKGAPVYPDMGRLYPTRLAVELDFRRIREARADAGVAALAAGDVLEVLQVLPRSQVLAVGLNVTTPRGDVLTVDVGDGADPDGYLVGVDGNTVSGYSSTQVTITEGTPNTVSPALAFGKYYNSADTIDVVLNNVPDDAVMTLWAFVVDCS